LASLGISDRCCSVSYRRAILMKRTEFSVQKFISYFCIAVAMSACGQQSTERQSVLKQDDADSNAANQDLAPADGIYNGPLHLFSVEQVFTVKLDVHRVMEPEHSQDSQDPSDTIMVPKLSGSMTFAALSATDNDNSVVLKDGYFGPLMDPMGGFSMANFSYGNFDPANNNQLVLPYSVTGVTGTYGQLSGTLTLNSATGLYHYSGTWSANPFGDVGSFELDVTPRGNSS
jgi:hypothetical protein